MGSTATQAALLSSPMLSESESEMLCSAEGLLLWSEVGRAELIGISGIGECWMPSGGDIGGGGVSVGVGERDGILKPHGEGKAPHPAHPTSVTI